MEVGILFSGGKDSTLAIEYALSKGWKINYLLSIKPNRTDCYLFHFASVEHTKKIAEILNLKHILVKCKVANPEQEANIVKKIVEKNPVDLLILGGIGLQETQIKSLREALKPLNTKVFASHAGKNHEELMKDMIERGYKIMITQIASDGMSRWLGKILTLKNFNELLKDSMKYGFHIGFEGGYADTLVIDGPIFNKKLKIEKARKIMENEYSGYLKIDKLKVI